MGRGWSCERLDFLLWSLVKCTRTLGFSSYVVAIPSCEAMRSRPAQDRRTSEGNEGIDVQSVNHHAPNFLPAIPIHRCFAGKAVRRANQLPKDINIDHVLYLIIASFSSTTLIIGTLQ